MSELKRIKIKHRYSGEKSKDFWNVVNAINSKEHGELYSLGVVLQNLEEFVLKRLKDCMPTHVKNKTNY